MPRRLSLVIFASVIIAGVALPAAGAQEEPSFVAQPGPNARTDPGGAFFLLKVRPGARLEQRVGLRNDGDRRLVLDLAAVDGETAETGGVSYNLAGEPIEGPGGWISLERDSVALAPGESKTVPFRVRVPDDAVSGIHLGGISVEPAESGQPEPTGQAQIVVTTRRVVPIVFDLPGRQAPELVVNGVEPDARPDAIYLEIEIENVGTDATEGEGTITLEDAGFEQDFVVGRFVPHTSIRYPVKWTTAVDDGEYCGHVVIEYEGKTAEWDGCFTVGEAVQRQLEERRGANTGERPWWFWPAIALSLLILLALAWWFLIGKKRRRRRSDEAAAVS